MPNFLNSLGSFLGNTAKSAGGAVKRDILGGRSGNPLLDRLGPGGTAGFNPAAADSLPKLGRPMSGADTGLINRAQSMQNQMPQLQRPESPSLEPIRDSVNISASNSGPVGGSDALGSLMDRMANRPASTENQQTQMLGQRPVGEVRPPDFMGRKGATMEDTPMSHERYGYQTQYMQDGKVPRRWQDIVANSIHGAAQGYQNGGGWEGALGGAAAGGIGSAVSPIHARDYRFNKEQMPRLQAQRGELERGQDRSFEMQKRGVDLAGTQARTQATIAGTKDQELERKYRMAQIEKANAQTEAVRLGKLTQRDILDEDGVIRTYNFYPGREPELAGGSAKAAMNTENNEARGKMNTDRIEGGMARTVQQGKDAYKRTQAQQGGANWRTTQTQAGQNARTADRLSAQYGDTYVPPQGKAPVAGSVPVRRATAKDVSDYAEMKNVSPEEARKRFEAKGYRVE